MPRRNEIEILILNILKSNDNGWFPRRNFLMGRSSILTSFSGEEILVEGNGECIKHIWDRNPNWKSIEKLMFKASGRILVLVATFLSGCCWDRSEYGPSRTFGSFLDEWNSCRTFSFTYLIARHTYGYTICFYLYKSDIYIYIPYLREECHGGAKGGLATKSASRLEWN